MLYSCRLYEPSKESRAKEEEERKQKNEEAKKSNPQHVAKEFDYDTCKYLTNHPVAVALSDGLLLWLEYVIEDGKGLVIKLDKRA